LVLATYRNDEEEINLLLIDAHLATTGKTILGEIYEDID